MGFSRNPDAPNLFMKVYSGGKEIRVDLTNRLLSFEYEDNERKADSAKWTIDNWDFKMFDEPIWRPGNIVNLTWGYTGNMSPPRSVCIHKTSGARVLNVEAIESGTALMNELDRSFTYENLSYSDVAEIICDRNGFGPDYRFIEPTTNVREVITQARMTDAQMLRRMAAKLGYQFYVDWDGLHFHRRDLGARPIREYRYYSGLQRPGESINGREDILDINIENNVYRRLAKVVTKGVDQFKKVELAAEADEASTDRSSNSDTRDDVVTNNDPPDSRFKIETGAVVQGRDGEIEILRANGDEVIARYAKTGKTGPLIDIGGGKVAHGDAKVHTLHVWGEPENIEKEAAKRYRRAAEHAVKMSINVIGDPLLVAKSNVLISNIGKRLSGKYYIKKCVHKIASSGGYTCELAMISDGHNGWNRSGYDALDKPLKKSNGKNQGDEVLDNGEIRPDPNLDPPTSVDLIAIRDSRRGPTRDEYDQYIENQLLSGNITDERRTQLLEARERVRNPSASEPNTGRVF